MAVMTDSDVAEIRDDFFRLGFGKEEYKALAGGMPNEAQRKAGLQAIEDFFVSNFATIKSGLDTGLSRTTTNQGAQKIIAAYLRWKIKQLLGA
jgi:hypothetical protein